MSVFKIRDTKKKTNKRSTFGNLSTIHHEKVNDFRKDRTSVREVQYKIDRLKESIVEIESKEYKSIEELKELSELKEEAEELEELIHRISSCSDMMDYYYVTSDIISAYNDLDIDPSKGKITITDFFRDYGVDSDDNNNSKKGHHNKKDLLEQYLEVTKPDYVRGSRTDEFSFCEFCEEEMTLKKDHGIYICTSCGRTNSVLVESDANKTSSMDGTKYSIYQRKNHFKEWLNQIQAKESTDIPQEVFDMILVELNKIHFENLAELDPSLVRNILKKLNLSRYYENVFHIIYRLNGLQPPTLAREVEDKLLHYFKQIEEPFRIYKKKGRKNILRYSYILYKLCELLELDEFLRCFRLLKNRTKLIEQDNVWASICKHLGWEFIPSM